MGKLIFKSLILFLVVIASGGIIFFVTNQSNPGQTIKLPIRVEAESPSFSQVSPDGKDTMNLKKETKSAITNFTFASNNISFYKSLPSDSNMEIPFNTWSPNDKYVFIKETTPGAINYYVLPGEINVTQKFYEKYPDNKLQEVTGWASNTLLIINASDSSGKDVSYWFEVTSGAFTRLSNRFN